MVVTKGLKMKYKKAGQALKYTPKNLTNLKPDCQPPHQEKLRRKNEQPTQRRLIKKNK